MSDDRRTTAAELPGEPAGWPAALRDLLRDLRRESPPPEATVERLREDADATGTDPAQDRLDFLEAVGVVDLADGRCRPGPYGEEFLEDHEETVLYEALTASVAGFETFLEALAIRPVTDVEMGDLFEREFDAESAIAHRKWLQALGYLTHEDGVNELTREGRLLVETDDALASPRERALERSTTESDARGADPDASVGDGATGASGPTDRVRTPGERREEPDVTGGSDRELRRHYDDTCMVCGDRRRRSPEEGFSRVYRPMPLDDVHGGPAEAANAVVVCPNHYADFEHGLLTVDPRTLEIDHAYEPDVSGRTLSTLEGHDPGAQYLAYHNEVVADF